MMPLWVHVPAVSIISPLTLQCISQWCHCHRSFFQCHIFVNDLKHYFLCVNLTRLHTAQRCHWYLCDLHKGVNDTAVTYREVSLTPLWHAKCGQWHQCDLHNGVNDLHSGVNDTAVTCTEVPMPLLWLRISYSIALASLKGISIEKKDKLSYFPTKIWGLFFKTKDHFLSQRCHCHRCQQNWHVPTFFSNNMNLMGIKRRRI
jgi:hypothetical protein